MPISDILNKLNNLYTATEEDWCWSISGSLTEPVCPCVTIWPEDYADLTWYTELCDRDDIEGALTRVVDKVHRHIILGEEIRSNLPFTNEIDQRWAKRLAEIREKRK